MQGCLYETSAGLPRQNTGKYNTVTAMRTASKSITNASVKKPLKATERKRQDEARISYIRKEHTKKVLREFSDADQQMGTIFSSSLKEDINQLLQPISSAGKKQSG